MSPTLAKETPSTASNIAEIVWHNFALCVETVEPDGYTGAEPFLNIDDAMIPPSPAKSG